MRIFSKFIRYTSYHLTIRSATCISMWRFSLFHLLLHWCAGYILKGQINYFLPKQKLFPLFTTFVNYLFFLWCSITRSWVIVMVSSGSVPPFAGLMSCHFFPSSSIVQLHTNHVLFVYGIYWLKFFDTVSYFHELWEINCHGFNR